MNLNLFANMPTIKYFARSNNDKLKTHVLYCRVRCNGSTAEFSTKQKINLAHWDQDQQKYRSKNKLENSLINELLEVLTYKIKMKAIHTDNAVTAKELIDFVSSGKKTEKQPKITELIEAYMLEQRQNQRAKAGTLRNHAIKLENLRLFEKSTMRAHTVENFDCVTAERFKEWFQSTKNTKNITTASRNVVFFKLVLSWAQKKGKIENFPLFQYKGEKDKNKEPVYLTESEFQAVLNKNFENEYLNRIKDLFIFQCVTGLAYGDIWSKFEFLESNGKKVIQGNRSKNNQTFFVPLSPIAEDILEKYNYQLPKYCNAVYNRIIKEVCACCGFFKKVSTHTARKTFATLQSEKGWSLESIAMMLGHSSVKTTEVYYLGKSFVRIENEMQKIG